jgi:bifunctional NMN adenylyltransferase/nudix hydrolase
MMPEFDYLVFIGRFQPLHNGHVHIINEALKRTEKLIILIGSSNQAPSPRNPFTFEQRAEMINRTIDRREIKADAGRIIIEPLRDTPYNDRAWIVNVQKTVDRIIDGHKTEKPPRIGLTGFKKDNTSYYVKMFPDWHAVDVKAQYGTLNATDIRRDFIRRAPHLPDTHLCPTGTASFFSEFMLTDAFKWLVAEAEFYDDYKAKWGITPYPVFINCVDAVVVQAGYVLLVERAHRPGRGLLALPGGHVEVNETFEQAVIRELKEETKIADGRGEIPPARLASFINQTQTRIFDDPHRSERGRVVTQAFLFELPRQTKLFEVRGSDDAAFAHWHEIGTLSSTSLFEDHAAIIEEMTGTIID